MRLGMCAALRNPYPSMSRQPLVAAKVPEGVIGADLSIRELDTATLEPMSPIHQHRRLQWSTSHVIDALLVEVRIDIASPRVLSKAPGRRHNTDWGLHMDMCAKTRHKRKRKGLCKQQPPP